MGTEMVRTRTRIRIQNRNTALTRPMLEEALLGAIVGRAGESGQVNQEGHFLRRCLEGLRGQEEIEAHFAVGRVRGMAKLEKLAAKRGYGCFGCDGHFASHLSICLAKCQVAGVM